MANDHDKHTCGCSDCNNAYNQRYYGSNDYDVKPSFKEFSNVELKNEIARRANERKELAKKAKVILEEKNRKDRIEAEKRRAVRKAALIVNEKILSEINTLSAQIESLKKKLK